jgi:putative DNA primase/helicase
MSDRRLPYQFIADAAQTFLHAHLSVGPIPPNAKYPVEQGWKTYQSRLPTPDELAAWFDGRSPMGLCIFCGKVSGGLEVLDFDELDTYHAFTHLVHELGYEALLQRLLIEHTPRPGVHLAYRCEEGSGNTKLARVKIGVLPNGKDDVKTLIETRGERGLIVVAPTPPGIHPDFPERGYELIQGDWTALPRITTEAREILWNCARALNRYDEKAPRHYGEPQSDQDRVGSDYNATVTQDEVQRLLEDDGWTCTVSRGDERYLLRPGKSGRGWSATLGVLAPKRLYVFSTNAHPFDHDRSYDPFGVYMRLKHGGDAKAAAKALAAMGYGRNGHPPDGRNPVDAGYEQMSVAEDIHLTDVGNGLRLVQQFGKDLRYVTTWKKWLIWQDGRWVIDEGGTVEWHAKQVIAGLYRWAQDKIGKLASTEIPEDETLKKARADELSQVTAILKWAHSSESGTHIELMVRRARVNPAIQVRHEDLDANPMLFQVMNGTIDLKTGKLRQPRQSDLITKRSPVVYDQHATCPLWRAALERWQGFPQPKEQLTDSERDKRISDADQMITYLKRLVGMSLTGDVGAQILLFLHGTGQNGKSRFLNTIRALMGDYGMQAAPNLLLVRDHEQHPTELADLFGKRFVSTIEVEKGKSLAEALMKTLTGEENVRARRMREDFWEFAPTWKVWFCANDKPKVKGRDKATWRRIKLIPFDVTIPDDEVDPKLGSKLLEELPGILNWAIEGCLEWQDKKLQEPDKVTKATEAYREETDIVAQFVRDCCFTGKDATGQPAKTQSTTLRKAFETYTGQMVSHIEFADIMAASGYKKKSNDGRVYWMGLGLKTTDVEADAKSRAAKED